MSNTIYSSRNCDFLKRARKLFADPTYNCILGMYNEVGEKAAAIEAGIGLDEASKRELTDHLINGTPIAWGCR